MHAGIPESQKLQSHANHHETNKQRTMNPENTGWIKLHRSIINWEWFTDQNTFRLFMYLLLSVNYEQKKWRGKIINPGEIVTSYAKLSEATGLSVRSIRTALSKLISTGELTSKTTNKYTVITVNNYIDYQETTNKTTNKRQSNDNQTTTTKEIKKERIYNIDAIASRKQDFFEEVYQFTAYPKTTLDAFFDFWTEPNKAKTKMRFELQKTWSTNLRLKTWASREKGFTKELHINTEFNKPKNQIAL